MESPSIPFLCLILPIGVYGHKEKRYVVNQREPFKSVPVFDLVNELLFRVILRSLLIQSTRSLLGVVCLLLGLEIRVQVGVLRVGLIGGVGVMAWL